MPVVEWSDKLSVGIEQMDAHHKYLVDLLNWFHNIYSSKPICNVPYDKTSKDLIIIFNKLTKYAINHFSMEEQLMEKFGYPDIEDHKKEHELFKIRIKEMHNDLQGQKNSIVVDITSFLQKWLVAHILHSDMKYGQFIAKQQCVESRSIDKP